MTNRITEKQLESMIATLNEKRGKTDRREGFLQLGCAYGGYRLEEWGAPSKFGQGIRCISPDGYGTKRQLYAFLCGLLA